MDQDEMKDLVSDLEKEVKKIGRIKQDISDLSDSVSDLEQEVNEIEQDLVRIDVQADQLPPKLQKLPDAQYLDEMIESVRDKMNERIQSVSRSSMSRKELYGYAALISFFTTLLVSIASLLLTFGFDFATINAG